MLFKKIFSKFKKNDTVVDLGVLQKRGIIKQKENVTKPSSDVVDLTRNESSNEGSALGFLGTLARASNKAPYETATDAETSNGLGPDGKKRLKGILRDIKAEMKSTSDRVYKISDRLDLLEKKMERLERRVGYP